MRGGHFDRQSQQHVGDTDADLRRAEDGGDPEPSARAVMAARQPGGRGEREDEAVADAAMEHVEALDAAPGREIFAVHAGRPVGADEAGIARGDEAAEHDLNDEEGGAPGGSEPQRGGGGRGRRPARGGEAEEASREEHDGEGEGVPGHEMGGDRPRRQELEDGQTAEHDLDGQEGGRHEEAGSHGAAQTRQPQGCDAEPQEDEADAAGEHPMAPFEGDLEIEFGDHLTEAERPVGAGEARAVGTHERAEHDQYVGRRRERRESASEEASRARFAGVDGEAFEGGGRGQAGSLRGGAGAAGL